MKSGETGSVIAGLFAVSLNDLAAANGGKDVSRWEGWSVAWERERAGQLACRPASRGRSTAPALPFQGPVRKCSKPLLPLLTPPSLHLPQPQLNTLAIGDKLNIPPWDASCGKDGSSGKKGKKDS